MVLAEIELCMLYEAMDKLTKRQMEVIRLYFYKGMSQQAIAQKLGIGRRAVGNCIEGALKKLKKFFKKVPPKLLKTVCFMREQISQINEGGTNL